MSYYRGDYYRGDYYRGDIFGSIWKGVTSVAKGVGGAVIGGLTGGVGGAIAGGVRGLLGSGSPATMPGGPNLPALPQPGGTPVVMGGGTAIVGVSPLGTLGVKGVGKGYHLNKSNYVTWRTGERVQKGTRLVKNRHMNPANGRALKRGLVRAHRFARLARSVMSFEITGRHHGRGHFKARRRGRR